MANPEGPRSWPLVAPGGRRACQQNQFLSPEFFKTYEYSEYSYYAGIILTTIIVIPNTILNIIVKHMPKVASSSPQKHWI